ncbi:MAG TPA: hypothetical protein PLX69_21570 [Leptospiraceae bacterium]|nr:hypothetical protein [Leptospiraceae bacterium]HRG77163.1 hypothetical protein [Leptospiraceae bacterium]
MENIPEEIIGKINSLQQDHKFKIIKYIEREIEVGRTPSVEELSSIIRYLKEGDKKTTLHEIEGISIEKEKPKKSNQVSEKWNCVTCRFQESGICKNKKSELYESKVFASIVCVHFLAQKPT